MSASFTRPLFSHSSSASNIGDMRPNAVAFNATTFPHTDNRDSDASVTIGATRGDTSIYPLAHNTPRPSYESMTSMYSTQTATAIDRAVPRTTLAAAPPVLALRTLADYMESNGNQFQHRSEYSKQANPLKVARNFGVHLTVPGAQPTFSTFSDSTASANSFEAISYQAINDHHRQEAINRLSGVTSEQYSPPS